MPIFWDREWTNHKGTESHSFTAGEPLLNFQYIKESVPGNYIAVSAITREEAIGYVVCPDQKIVQIGEQVEVLLGEWIKPINTGGPGSGVLTVDDDNNGVVEVDNTDPQNPIITFPGVFVEDSITGDGNSATPLQFVNDQLSPGADHHYGTDGAGVKGWFPDTVFVPYTDEQAQDAVGLIGLDTQTVDFTYNDGAPSMQWDVITQLSVDQDAGGVKLVNDLATPGNNFHYGTDAAGTKGWYADAVTGQVNTIQEGQNVDIDSTDPVNPIVHACTEDVQFTGTITPPAFGVPGNVNDYNPAGLATASTIYLTVGSSGVFITGLAGGTLGRFLLIHNTSNLNVTFVNQSGASAVANRFFLTGNTDYVLGPNEIMLLQYDLALTRWRMQGQPNNPPPTDVLIGNTLFVDVIYGNDGTGAPNSLVNKYATIEGARSASVPGDLIHIFPGVHVITSTMHMDGSQAFDFYCEPGVTIQAAVGAPAIMLYPINKFRWKGWADFDWWDGSQPFWDNSDTASGQSLVEFEFNTIVFSLEFGTPGTNVFAYLYSQIGYIAGNFVKDMQFKAPGFQIYQIGIDKFDNTDMGISAFYFGDFLANDGGNFVGTIARTNISGRNNDKCEIRRGISPGIYVEEGGLAAYRHIQIKADLILNTTIGMECRSGTIDHWGNIESQVNDGGGFVLTPCIKFTETIGRETMIYTHHEGRFSHTENCVISGDKAGKFTFKGDYRNASKEGFATLEWHSSGGVAGIGAYLFYDGNFRNGDTNPIFRINENNTQDLIKQTFLTCTAQGTSGFFMDNTVYATALDIFVVHSLVTNVLPNGTVTDVSTGGRWYTDTGLDMGL